MQACPNATFARARPPTIGKPNRYWTLSFGTQQRKPLREILLLLMLRQKNIEKKTKEVFVPLLFRQRKLLL